MNTYFGFVLNGPVSQKTNMRNMLGAVKLPLFLVLWSLSLVVVLANVRTADAAMMTVNINSWSEKEMPSFDESLNVNLKAALKNSELASGIWQPSVETSHHRAKLAQVHVDSDSAVTEKVDSAKSHTNKLLDTVRKENVPSTRSLKIAELANAIQSVPNSGSDKQFMEKRPVDKLARTKNEARRHMHTGNHDQAYEMLRRELATVREDKEYLGLTAVAAIRSGRMLDASILYERLTELEPDQARWWAGLGVSQEALGLVATSSFHKAQTIAESGSVLDEYASLRIIAQT